MKINGIKALDYQAKEQELELVLAETTLEEITGMQAELLRVTTDDGVLVEAFAGYRLKKVVYSTEDGSFRAIFEPGVEDITAEALAALTEALKEQQVQINEQADALIELAALAAGEV